MAHSKAATTIEMWSKIMIPVIARPPPFAFPWVPLALKRVDERAQDEGQQCCGNGAHQDESVVIGADSSVNERAQTTLPDHCSQDSPADRVNGGHSQTADDGRQRQGNFNLIQALIGGHAAAPGRFNILRVHRDQPCIGVFQDREHRVDGQRDEHCGRLHAQPDEQKPHKDNAGDGIEHREHRQHKFGQLGPTGEQNAQHHAQDQTEQHGNQGEGEVGQNGLGKIMVTHWFTPTAVPPLPKPCWSW